MSSAEENKKSIEWMTEQRDRLKAEVDALAPQLTVAQAGIRERDAAIALLQRERDEAVGQADDLKTKLSACEEYCRGLKSQLSTLQSDIAETKSRLSSIAALATSRRASLARVMKLVSDVTTEVLPLLNENE